MAKRNRGLQEGPPAKPPCSAAAFAPPRGVGAGTAEVKPSEEQAWSCQEDKQPPSRRVSPAWVTFVGSPRDLAKFMPAWGREPGEGWGCTCFWGKRNRHGSVAHWDRLVPTCIPYQLPPAPCSRAGLLPQWLPASPWHQAQLLGATPLPEVFAPVPGASLGSARAGSRLLAAPLRPSPVALSPCQGALGEARVRCLWAEPCRMLWARV